MKKIALAFIALMMTSASMMAQNNEPVTPGNMPPQVDPAQMIEQYTQQMTSQYGLNDDQARQLLQLNKDFAERLPMMMMPPRGGRDGQRPDSLRGRRGGRPQGGPRMGGQRPQRPDSMRHGGPGRGQMGQRPMIDRQQMQQNMEAYQQQLERIMTEEQFNRYKQDQQQRMQRFMRGGQRGGQRGNRPDRN